MWLSVHNGPASVDPSLSAALVWESATPYPSMLELRGDLLLCDDVGGKENGQLTWAYPLLFGTLGLIDEAAFLGLIDFEEAIGRLTQTANFHHASPLINRVHEQLSPASGEPARQNKSRCFFKWELRITLNSVGL